MSIFILTTLAKTKAASPVGQKQQRQTRMAGIVQSVCGRLGTITAAVVGCVTCFLFCCRNKHVSINNILIIYPAKKKEETYHFIMNKFLLLHSFFSHMTIILSFQKISSTDNPKLIYIYISCYVNIPWKWMQCKIRFTNKSLYIGHVWRIWFLTRLILFVSAHLSCEPCAEGKRVIK